MMRPKGVYDLHNMAASGDSTRALLLLVFAWILVWKFQEKIHISEKEAYDIMICCSASHGM